MTNEITELTEHEALTQQSESALEELETATEIAIDYGQLGKDDFVKLAEEQLGILKAPGVKVADFKRVDEVVKKIRPLLPLRPRTPVVDQAATYPRGDQAAT